MNWLNQWDPRLIEFIRDEILIPPPSLKQKLNLTYGFDEHEPWNHQGQNGEVLAVEYVHGLGQFDKNRSE